MSQGKLFYLCTRFFQTPKSDRPRNFILFFCYAKQIALTINHGFTKYCFQNTVNEARGQHSFLVKLVFSLRTHMEFWAVEEHLPLNPTPPPLPIEWLFIISISSNRCASRDTRFRAEYPFPVPFPVAPPGSPHLPSITLLRWVTPKEADTSDLKIQTRKYMARGKWQLE